MSTLAKVALGAAVVALVVGGALAAGFATGEADRVAEAERVIERLYASEDVEEARGFLVEESVRSGPERAEQVDEILQAVLAQPFEVTDSDAIEVLGEEVVEVTVGEIRWCVRADDQVLLGCRVAAAEVRSALDTPDLTVIFAGVDVIADRIDAVVVVASETGDWIPIEGEPEIDVPAALGRGVLVETALAGAAQRVAIPLDMLRAYPDAGALLAFEMREVEDLGALEDATLTVAWEGVTVTLEVTTIEWFVG